MQTDDKLKKRIAYEKMLAGISERAVSVDDLDNFLDSSLKGMGSIVDVRVIASTNHNLKETIKLGEFRKDLYYRLHVIEIKLPTLRERYEDIPLLINHFCRIFKKSYN
jgi:sigma54-dependent transcription regulator